MNRNTTILILSSSDSGNRAFEAFMTGVIKCISKHIPQADIIALSNKPASDKFLQKHGVKICQNPWARRGTSRTSTLISYVIFVPLEFCRCLIYRFGSRFSRAVEDPYKHCDVVIDTDVIDRFDERHYGHILTMHGLVQILISQAILRRPTITIPATIGPFTTKLTLLLAKRILNKLNIIAVSMAVCCHFSIN